MGSSEHWGREKSGYGAGNRKGRAEAGSDVSICSWDMESGATPWHIEMGELSGVTSSQEGAGLSVEKGVKQLGERSSVRRGRNGVGRARWSVRGALLDWQKCCCAQSGVIGFHFLANQACFVVRRGQKTFSVPHWLVSERFAM